MSEAFTRAPGVPSTPQAARRARALRVLTELPLPLGVLLGWVAAWWRGKAFVLDGLPHGYGWFDYLNNAWMIVHRQQVGYNNFREPLHAWMVGTLGEAVGSYPDAATLVASAGVFGVCVGAGLFGRALVGPWTGALCAAAVPWTAHAADMAHWANYYGVAGCLAGACLGLGALAWLRPHPALAAATGILAGLTWGVDPRTMTVAVGGVCLVLLGLTRAGPSWKARLLALALLGAGLALGPWSHDVLWLREVADPPWQQRVSFQGPVVARWISRKAELAAVCSDYPRLSLRDLATGSCGQTLLQHNLEVVLPRHLHFGLKATLAGLLLCLLPGRQGWRGSLAGLSLCSGALGLLLASSEAPEAVAGDLERFALICLDFPRFQDGRAFSAARKLRQRFGFKGELRAVGNVLRDQFHFMVRCGFDSFEVADGTVVGQWSRAMSEISVAYQPAADSRATALEQRSGGRG